MKLTGAAATRPSFAPAALDHAAVRPLVPVEAIIDIDHLARMTLGEPSLEHEVLQLFDRQAAMLLARMANEPPKVVGALAHTLTGSARGIGAWKVAAAGAALERAAIGPDHADMTRLVERLSVAVNEARAAIAEMARAH